MKLTTTVWAYYSEYSKEWTYTMTDSDMSDSWVRVCDAEVEYEELPREHLTQEQAKIFQAEKQMVLADAHVKATAIDHKIQDLLSIEDKSGQEPDDIPF